MKTVKKTFALKQLTTLFFAILLMHNNTYAQLFATDPLQIVSTNPCPHTAPPTIFQRVGIGACPELNGFTVFSPSWIKNEISFDKKLTFAIDNPTINRTLFAIGSDAIPLLTLNFIDNSTNNTTSFSSNRLDAKFLWERKDNQNQNLKIAELRGNGNDRHSFTLFNTEGLEAVVLNSQGTSSIASKLKIGNITEGSYMLAVGGKIGAKDEVRVFLSNVFNFPDYVFEPSYKLPKLSDVEAYVKENKHLPEVPSAKEVEKDGMSLNDMNLILLKKVEELTLYAIEQEKKIKALEAENAKLKELEQRIKALETKSR